MDIKFYCNKFVYEHVSLQILCIFISATFRIYNDMTLCVLNNSILGVVLGHIVCILTLYYHVMTDEVVIKHGRLMHHSNISGSNSLHIFQSDFVLYN